MIAQNGSANEIYATDDHLKQTVAIVAMIMDAAPNTPPEKLQKAKALVLADKVQAHEDGLYTVQGSHKTYEVGGLCECPAATMGKTKWCKHLVAVEIWERVQMRLHPSNGDGDDFGKAWKDELRHDTQEKGDNSVGVSHIPAQFITQIHGKDFVQYAGLLAMAHDRGLWGITARFISVDSELALAEATADFKDGSSFSECADATPGNVTSKIKPHFARMALTRAKARCLRDALNISVCSVEEL